MTLEADPVIVDGIKRALWDSADARYTQMGKRYSISTISSTKPLRDECASLGIDDVHYQDFIARIEQKFALEIDERSARSLGYRGIEDLARYVKMRVGSHPEKLVSASVADRL